MWCVSVWLAYQSPEQTVPTLGEDCALRLGDAAARHCDFVQASSLRTAHTAACVRSLTPI